MASQYDEQDEPYSAVPLYQPKPLPANSRYKQANPNARPTDFQDWIDTQTGQRIQGSLAANDPNKIVTGFSRGNPQNTTSYDINTGEKSEANPHPWLDALKNTAMIWGGPETAGAFMGAWGGAGAAGLGGSSGTTTGIGPSFAAAPSSVTAGTGPSLATQMATNAAQGAVRSKLSGGSWRDALISAGIGAGMGAAGNAVKGIGPSSSFGAKVLAGAAGKTGGTGLGGVLGRAAGRLGMNAVSNIGSDSTSTYSRGSENGIGPSQGAMQAGFGYSDTNPNVAALLKQGNRQAIRDQPFRMGHDVNTTDRYGNIISISTMPPIYPTGGGRRRQQPNGG